MALKKQLSVISYQLSVLAFVALCFLFLIARTDAANSTNVRVRLSGEKDEVRLAVKGAYTIEAIDSDLILKKGANLSEEKVIPAGSGIQLGEEIFKIYGIRVIPKKDAGISVDGKQFRGIIDIIRTENMKLLVVNHIDVEKYLYGVLYHEVPHYWPMETQKAQAVAARTFAMYRKTIMRDKDYDVTSDIYSQVYGGKGSEHGRARKAVDLTKGEVLIFDGKILPSYYHSICAGHTESSLSVFELELAPLKGVKCPYCRGARGENWKASFSFKQMEKRLNDYGIPVKEMRDIRRGKRNRSGRLETIKIKDKEGEKEIKGYKFRLALDPNMIRSTNFTIKITPKGVIFKGKGWGHGVGMCQWGAFGMAKKRARYKKILEFYYPEAKINEINGL